MGPLQHLAALGTPGGPSAVAAPATAKKGAWPGLGRGTMETN
jgi:hypothetical protein